MNSIEEIQQQLNKNAAERKELDAALERARKAARKITLAEIVESIDKAGLTIEDVAEAYANRNTKTDKLAKYQDPVTGETAMGNGRKPKWLVEAIASGKKLEDFLIVNESK